MAKKRHHQSVRSREHEAAGMARHDAKRGHHDAPSKRHHSGAHEAQMPPHGYEYDFPIGARPMHPRVNSMIEDDRRAPANLPQHVMEKYYPTGYNKNMGYVNDLYHGAEKQLDEDYRDMYREMGPKKY